MKVRIIVFASIVIFGSLIAGFMIQNKKTNENTLEYREKHDNRLKVVNPYDVNKDLVDDSLQLVRTGHKVSDFKFVNQYGDSITQSSLEGQIYVSNFFFTSGVFCSSLSLWHASMHKAILCL